MQTLVFPPLSDPDILWSGFAWISDRSVDSIDPLFYHDGGISEWMTGGFPDSQREIPLEGILPEKFSLRPVFCFLFEFQYGKFKR